MGNSLEIINNSSQDVFFVYAVDIELKTDKSYKILSGSKGKYSKHSFGNRSYIGQLRSAEAICLLTIQDNVIGDETDYIESEETTEVAGLVLRVCQKGAGHITITVSNS